MNAQSGMTAQYPQWNRRLLGIYWIFYGLLAAVTAIIFLSSRFHPQAVNTAALSYSLYPILGNLLLLVAANLLYSKVVVRWRPVRQACYILSVMILLCSVLVGVNYFNSLMFFLYTGPILFSVLYIDSRVLIYTCAASMASYLITYFGVIAPFRDPVLYSRSVYDIFTSAGVLTAAYLIATLILRRIREAVRAAEALCAEKARLSRELERDPFTRLYNHAAFIDQLDRSIMGASGQTGAFSLMIMDIDNFKRINDNYGHDTGDTVLLRLVAVLNEETEEGDLAFRYGGEEFTVLCRGAVERARELAERIRMKFSRHLFLELGGGTVTVSIGVCHYESSFGGRREFFSAADKALYRAKREGKNRVAVWEEPEGVA